MDSLHFSDDFSYIIYFILSYGLISMNFRSFNYFVEFSELLKIQKSITASAWRHRGVSRADQVKPDVWGPHVSDTGLTPGQTRTDQGLTWLWGPLSAAGEVANDGD